MIDLLVAGGGPAGLATALYARRAGLEVAVLEPRAAPIDKACGEGIMPGGVRALAELDVEVDGQPLRGIRYLAGPRQVATAFRAGPGAGIRRTALHAALHTACLDVGVPVHAERVGELTQDAASVRAAGLQARWLVAADGLHSGIRSQLGLSLPSRTPYRWGVRAHFPRAPWTDYVEVHWSPGSEAYVTPVGPDCVGVAVLTGRRGGFDEQLRAFPGLVAQLHGAPAGGVRGAGPLRQRVRGRVAGRVLLVGDAAGYVDALTGEGLALAFTSARELVGCLVDGRPADWDSRWRRLTRRHRMLTGALLWTARQPPLRRAIVPAAQRAPALFAAAVHAASD